MELRKNHLLLVFAGSLLVGNVRTYPRAEYFPEIEKSELNNSPNFDALIFTQQWPKTVCYAWKKAGPSNTCNLPQHDGWTIHGVWPTELHKLGPQFCNDSIHFHADALAPIAEEMRAKWIDIHDAESYSFWEHEWRKHGSCSAHLEAFNTEEKYFKNGLRLLDIYDMRRVLRQDNILPGQSYSVDRILDAVTKVLGKRAIVACISNKKHKISYLFEIRICFDKTLELIDCDEILGFPTNCSPKRDVVYLGNIPTWK